ncbi:hypothetical protein [Actinoallomurus rhizosphaericola]|uniref:hypothetical protein n=1 Tax=Actinoallomurus rhizosphaericola TaxID=2952536 RepID=UPI00209026D0|nr:hypothetical protein [Actinoallomurus rhizosphaericola]MCO5994330.1 hypothetical protein [Actinoallomurus rhizosphaericola]
MGETGKYTADPAKAQAAVEAMEELGNYVFNIAARFRNGVNFDVLGNDKAFGAPAKEAAIRLVDEIATGTEAASRMLLAVPMALRANQKSVVNQQGRALTAVHDAKSMGGWRTPSSFGGRE